MYVASLRERAVVKFRKETESQRQTRQRERKSERDRLIE